MFPDKKILPWQLAVSSIERGLPAMLLYVLESKGSSPGRQGFFMVVNQAGEMEGSIGGGIMEHKFTEMARDRLKEGEVLRQLRRQVHDKEAARDQSGMICSGEQTIFLYALSMTDLDTMRALVASLEQHRNGELRLSPEGLRFAAAGPTGLRPIIPEGLTPAPVVPEEDYYFDRRSEEDWEYVEKTGYKDRLYIVGAGHCGLAFSRLMQTMDFYITVFDHRPDLETLLRNEHVHEKVVVGDYDELGWRIAGGGKHHYVVVMTQGYRTDDRAMRALLSKEFRYFGLLGSKAKIGRMMTDYRAEGINEDWLRRVHAPAGLAIHSQTPEEIAVSIAAEIIGVKQGGAV